MKLRVSSREFTEWVEFYKSYPWDYGAAFIVATITNMMRAEGKEAKTPFDFMPADFVPTDPADEMWDHLRHAAVKDSKNGKH